MPFPYPKHYVPFWSEDEQKARDLDADNEMAPDDLMAYVGRLVRGSDALRKRQPYNGRGAENARMRRDYLNQSGLAGGSTNFLEYPEAYMAPETTIHPAEPFFAMNEDISAYVYPKEPTRLYYNSHRSKDSSNQQPMSRILPHEGSHTLYNRYQKNRRAGDPDIEPKFSKGFRRKLALQNTTEANPFRGGGIGTVDNMESYDPDEVIAYLMGREGELRPGQTLADDPQAQKLFSGYPEDWKEYERVRKILYDAGFGYDYSDFLDNNF